MNNMNIGCVKKMNIKYMFGSRAIPFSFRAISDMSQRLQSYALWVLVFVKAKSWIKASGKTNNKTIQY